MSVPLKKRQGRGGNPKNPKVHLATHVAPDNQMAGSTPPSADEMLRLMQNQTPVPSNDTVSPDSPWNKQ